jgi:putative peptidoglycan lipid II flippase
MLLLRRALNLRIGHTGLHTDYVIKLWSAATAGAAVAWFVKIILPTQLHPALTAVFVLGAYGLVFLGTTFVLRIPEALSLAGRGRAVN